MVMVYFSGSTPVLPETALHVRVTDSVVASEWEICTSFTIEGVVGWVSVGSGSVGFTSASVLQVMDALPEDAPSRTATT